MRSKLLLLSLVAVCLLGLSAHAQSFAITNARIVTVSGSTIDKGTVVVRNGLIDSVGANVSVPADATVFDANGSTVYPGFIDAVSNLGLAAPQAQTPGGGGGGGGGFGGQAAAAAAAAAAQNPSNSNYPVGLRPEERLEDQIRAGEAQFETARNAGFTTVLTTGRTGIFTGQSVLINLAGENVSGMIIKSPVAQHVSFVTLPGSYPVSLLGTFAAIRQILNDSRRLMENQRAYAANPKGMQRPGDDKSLEALIPALNKQMPVVFNANSEVEIIRALDMIKEYGLVGMIAGGQEAWRVADRLKAANVPVLLSLNFPRRTAAASPDADPEPLRVLRLRADVPKGPGRLAAAGVKFAFTSGGAAAPGDFFTNAGKAVEAGLNRDTAIRAMTLGAAELLGVDNRLGSIEKGKIANLVVVRGDVFAANRFASHVFVDGKLFEPREPTRGPGGRPGAGNQGGGSGAGAAATSVAGTYAITIQIPGQPLAATLNITQQGGAISGTMVSQMGTSPVNNGKVTGNNFNFTSSVQFGGSSIEITVNGTVTGNQVTGTVDSPQGNIPFSGTRNP
jgi:imidazolonepropionase-like amidohydrolase